MGSITVNVDQNHYTKLSFNSRYLYNNNNVLFQTNVHIQYTNNKNTYINNNNTKKNIYIYVILYQN